MSCHQKHDLYELSTTTTTTTKATTTTTASETPSAERDTFFGKILGSSMGAVKPHCEQVCTGTANNWADYNGGTKGITQKGKILFSDLS